MKKLLLNGTIGLLFMGLVGTQAVNGKGTRHEMYLSRTLSVHPLIDDSIPWSTNRARKSLEQREKNGTLKADTNRPKKDTATWNNQQKNWQLKSKKDRKHHKSEIRRDSIGDGKKSF
jgi:hypothetical protein